MHLAQRGMKGGDLLIWKRSPPFSWYQLTPESCKLIDYNQSLYQGLSVRNQVDEVYPGRQLLYGK